MENHPNSFVTQSKEQPQVKEILEFILSDNYNNSLVINACSALGILHDQIFPKTTSDFDEKHSSKETVTVRLQHYEARRRAKLIVISEYIVQNNLYDTGKSKRIKLGRSFSSVSPVKSKPDIPLAIPISPRQLSSHKLSLAKNSILKRLKFEEKRKKIQEDEALNRKQIEEKIKEKMKKSERKDPVEKKKFFEKHQKRIEEILKKKHNDLNEHELKALNHIEEKKDDFKNESISVASSPKKFYSFFMKPETEQDIDLKLMKINSKLSHSAERARKALINKANSGGLTVSHITKVKHVKEEMDMRKEEEKNKKIIRMHQSFVESNRRREEIMSNELKKRTKSSKAIEERRVEEYLKLEQEHMEKERILELKEERREKTRQEIRDSIEKRSQLLFTRNYIRKKEQEKNMRKINKHLEYVRKSNIDRIKDSELGSRTKHEINFARLRAQMELELRTAVSKNI